MIKIVTNIYILHTSLCKPRMMVISFGERNEINKYEIEWIF